MVSSAADAASAALVSGYLDSASENELWPEVEHEEAASASRVRGAICSKCAYRKPAWNENAGEVFARSEIHEMLRGLDVDPKTDIQRSM